MAEALFRILLQDVADLCRGGNDAVPCGAIVLRDVSICIAFLQLCSLSLPLLQDRTNQLNIAPLSLIKSKHVSEGLPCPNVITNRYDNGFAAQYLVNSSQTALRNAYCNS